MFRSPNDITRVPMKCCCESAKELSELPIFNCEFCDESWHSETEVHIHKKKHLGEVTKLLSSNKQLCYSCIKTFDTESALIKHVKTFHLLSSEDAQRVEREIFICNNCEQIFFNKAMLIAHLALCHKIISRQNQKLKCPKSTCKKHVACKRMMSHLYFHYMQSIMSCPICFHKCSGLTECQAHARMHKKYLYCDICGAAFKDSICFQNHTAGHCKNPPMEQDKVTDSYSRYFSPRFSTKFRYKKISTYKGYRLQHSLKICILCREICTNEEEAENHITRHYVLESHRTGIEKTNYNCEKCGEEFTHKILLKQHQTKCEVHVDVDDGEEENIDMFELSSNEEYEVIQVIE